MSLRMVSCLSLLGVLALPAAGLASSSITQDVRIRNEQFVAPNGGMSRPQLIEYGTPLYTDEARSERIEGVVSFEVEFDTDGNFRVLRLVKGLGHGLDEQAMEVLKTYRFAPAYRSGRRVGVIAHIDVAFNLRDFRTPVYKVIDGDEIKVVSLPGGFFYVGTGLNLVEDEAELDPTITEYVNRIGQQIANQSDAKVPFAIIDSDGTGSSK